MKNYFDLSGRVALITGGGSGIGKGCAKVLADAGAKVMVVGRRHGKLEDVKAEIALCGGICETFSADLSYEEGCAAMIDAVLNRFGSLDILINSAGSRGAHGKLEEEFSTENFQDTMNADFSSIFMSVKYAYPRMNAGTASIINIASLAGLYARGPIVYSAAKGAVKSFSRTVAKRFGPLGIRVNTIYPGFIVTEMTQKALEDETMRQHFLKESPLGRIGEVDDVALCALYLASDAARFVTGQDFVVDGGATC